MPEVLSLLIGEHQVDLEENCPDCQGEGSRRLGAEFCWLLQKCLACDGRGVLLTDNGQAVVTLVETHLSRREVHVLGPR
jgi:DnaJ-class molecular chaperone